MTKEEIAGVLEQIATLLELKAENPFKIRAYTNAARAIETFGANVSNFQGEEAVAEIPGIGKSLLGSQQDLLTVFYLDLVTRELPASRERNYPHNLTAWRIFRPSDFETSLCDFRTRISERNYMSMKTSSKVAVRAIAVLIILAANVYPQAIPPDPNTIAPVINAPHPQTNIVISLANYLVENGHPVPPHLALTHALDACRAQHAARLIVPTGRYVFNDPQIAQQMFHIGVFSLADLTIDGQGSDFVFHYPHTGFLIQDCHRVVIRNLTIDTDLVLASLGVAHRAGGNTNIRFLDSYPVAAGTPLLAVSPYDIANLKWKAIPGEIFNPRNVTMIAPQTFTSPDFASLADGEEVIVRHYTYGGNAFVAYGNTTADIGIENVTIYGAPGMGFYFSADRGFRLSGDRIVQRAGTPLSTATDGCHFTNNRGDILVENCDFSGQGDDSVNLASLWIPITHVDSARTFVATRQYDDLLVRQGSQLKIVRANDLSELGRVSVTQVSYDPASGRFSITVGQNLPANVSVGDLITNLTQSNPRFLIRGNYFHDHRARGMLVQALNGVVEDNVVRHSTMSGIELFTEATYFLEGPGAENVIVKNNTFDRCGYGNYGTGFDTMGVINMSAGVPTGISGYGVNRNILIDGNVVSNAPGLAVFLGSASDITLSNNVVINSNTLGAFPPWYGSAIGVVPHGSIMAANASNVLLTDNLEVNRYQQPETGIYFDPGTTTGSRVQNNSRATPSARGTLSLTGAYVSGSPITVLATPDAGAHFVNWTENGSVVGASRSFSFTLHANRNLLANFALGAPPRSQSPIRQA